MLKSLRRNEQIKAITAGLVVVALNVVVLASILSHQNYMPHAVCWRGDNQLIWSLAGSNLLIFISYMVISAGLMRLIFLVNLGPLAPVAAMFGFFIFTCGLTHLVDVVMIWHGAFWIQACAVLICAVPSVATAMYLARKAKEILEIARMIFSVYSKGPHGG